MMSNPDETAAKGNWSDPAFLARVADLNPQAKHTQFADFHGHGWVFRAVFKKDRHGNLLDHRGEHVADDSTAALMAAVQLPAELKERYRTRNAAAAQQARLTVPPQSNRDGLPVHQLDIHLEKGNALRRLPLHPGRARQHQALRRSSRGHRDSVH